MSHQKWVVIDELIETNLILSRARSICSQGVSLENLKFTFIFNAICIFVTGKSDTGFSRWHCLTARNQNITWVFLVWVCYPEKQSHTVQLMPLGTQQNIARFHSGTYLISESKQPRQLSRSPQFTTIFEKSPFLIHSVKNVSFSSAIPFSFESQVNRHLLLWIWFQSKGRVAPLQRRTLASN